MISSWLFQVLPLFRRLKLEVCVHKSGRKFDLTDSLQCIRHGPTFQQPQSRRNWYPICGQWSRLCSGGWKSSAAELHLDNLFLFLLSKFKSAYSPLFSLRSHSFPPLFVFLIVFPSNVNKIRLGWWRSTVSCIAVAVAWATSWSPCVQRKCFL